MVKPFEFKKDKALEAILYIVEKTHAPSFHQISKIMYFADRDHLEKYGRFIAGDSYVAMKHGPVPSGTYDLLKSKRSPPLQSGGHAFDADTTFEVRNGHDVKGLRAANLDRLSDSDVECLDSALSKYGSLSFNQLTELSHDATWSASDANDLIEIEDFLNTFENSRELSEHLKDPHPGGSS